MIDVKQTEPTISLMIRVPETLHKRLKIISVEKGESMQDIAVGLITDYVANNTK